MKTIYTAAWVLGLLVIGYLLFPILWKRFSPKKQAAITSIAVLPFMNVTGNPDQAHLSDGLTEGILNSLAKVEGLKVSARNSSFKFRGEDINIKEVGEKLNVQMVLEGSVQLDGDRILITAQLINVEDEFHFWSEQYDEKVNDIFALQDRIANAIVDKLGSALLLSERNKLVTKPVTNQKAYEFYLQGRVHLNLRTPHDLKKGIDYFEQSIALDKSFAASYAGLADCYNALGYASFVAPMDAFPKAKEAATMAMQLDSTLAEPHASLGFYYFYHAWDWKAAEQEFRIAIALNPNYALAYAWYAYYLTAMQQYDEALVILQKATALDPLSDPLHTDIGFSLYYSGNYVDAINQLETCLQTNPKFGPAHLWLGRSFQQQQKFEQAILAYQKALEGNAYWPVALAALGNAYGTSGDNISAKQVLITMDSLSTKKFVTSYGVALVYSGLGEKEKTFEWLNKAYKERSNWLVWLRTDPRFNSLHFERRFSELANQVGLPQ
ncbi:MAG: tetratricopeptide repeat protein [Cyclobacteriaceae bacterium]